MLHLNFLWKDLSFLRVILSEEARRLATEFVTIHPAYNLKQVHFA